MEKTPYISTNPDEFDRIWLHKVLSESYWAEGRTLPEIETMLQYSTNYGLFLNGRQIGYARVISDRMFLAYLMDVIIDPQYRGRGYAHILLRAVFEDTQYAAVKKWRLGTRDAHGLYERYGFYPAEHPEFMMEMNPDENKKGA